MAIITLSLLLNSDPNPDETQKALPSTAARQKAANRPLWSQFGIAQGNVLQRSFGRCQRV